MPAAASPVKTKPRARYRVLSPPGLRVKQLVLGIGAVYFTFVAVTNVVNFIVSVGGYHWSFLNSGNVSYIASITKVYSWPGWFDKAAVLAASLVETAGALLFWKALRNFRGHGTGVCDAWIALGWNIMVWLGFRGTEFFVAYQSEGPFRELLAISLLMAIVIAVVPDEAGLPDGQPQGQGTPGRSRREHMELARNRRRGPEVRESGPVSKAGPRASTKATRIWPRGRSTHLQHEQYGITRHTEALTLRWLYSPCNQQKMRVSLFGAPGERSATESGHSAQWAHMAAAVHARGCIAKQASGNTDRMVDDTARDRAIYHALKAADESRCGTSGTPHRGARG